MSLPSILRLASTAVLLLVLFATSTDAGRSDADVMSIQGADWNGPDASAEIVSEPKARMPKGATQAVELLRFVTAYKKGVEAMVDITPYSALLRASADTDGDLTFFAFIDTWVGNNTQVTKPITKMDSAGKCFPATKQEDAWGDGGRQGNGWQVDADLVFWPKVGVVDTRPRESITISSGYYGSYSIGSITAHEGTVGAGGAAIELKNGADLTGTLDAQVYPCPGGAKDVEGGIKMGQVAKRVHSYKDNSSMLTSTAEDVHKHLVEDSMTVLTVSSTDEQKRTVEVTFDPNDATLRLAKGMPVWYEKDDILEGQHDGYGQFPAGQSIGEVVGVQDGKATIAISGSCVPDSTTHWLPRLKLEKYPGALARARKLSDSVKTLKTRLPVVPQEEDPENMISLLAESRGNVVGNLNAQPDESVYKPFLVGQDEDGLYSPLPILGQVDLAFLKQAGADFSPPTLSLAQTAEELTDDPGSATATAQRLSGKAGVSSGDALAQTNSQLKAGDKVCVLARRANGRVFERTFDLPTFVPAAAAAASAADATAAKKDDRVLMQFAVTGHGWAGSTEQCGEFCHAIYHINVNGKRAFDVTEWRDDCAKNPVNGQFGTWEIQRDGWCPGSVEPGLYLDMTKWLKNGRNDVSVDLSVWSSKTRQYQKYTNYGNYMGGGDGAVLFVGATLFVYDGEAADAINNQKKAYTAAEAALRAGSSLPKALEPPHEVNSAFGASLLEQPGSSFLQRKQIKWKIAHKHKKRLSLLAQRAEVHAHARYDFEARAPWYNYNEARDGTPGTEAARLSMRGATVVPAFTDSLIDINSREIRAKVKRSAVPEEWGHAAMHIRLEQPTGRSMDNWDRVGSLGLIFEESAATTTDANSRVKLRPSIGRKLTTSWKLARAAVSGPEKSLAISESP